LAYAATSGATNGIRFVRMTWSGVAGLRCATDVRPQIGLRAEESGTVGDLRQGIRGGGRLGDVASIAHRPRSPLVAGFAASLGVAAPPRRRAIGGTAALGVALRVISGAQETEAFVSILREVTELAVTSVRREACR
jgi:hypothetical protein